MIEVHFSLHWLLKKRLARVQISYFIEFRLSMPDHESFSEALMAVVALIAKPASALHKVHTLFLFRPPVGVSLPFHQ